MEDFQKLVNEIITQTKNELKQNQNYLKDETILTFYYLKLHLKDKNLSEENKFYLRTLKNEYIKKHSIFIVNDLRFLIFYYLILSLDNEKNAKEKFFKIYLTFEKYTSIYNNVDFLHLIFPQDKLDDFIENLISAYKKNDFWCLNIIGKKKIIFNLFYITLMAYERSKKPFKILFNLLNEIYNDAIKKEDDELIFFLQTPLQFSWNGVTTLQKDFKYYNDNIEIKLEKYIENKMIKKFNIIPNTRKIKKNQKIKIAFLQERIINYSINKVFVSLLKNLRKNPNNNYEIIILDLAFFELGGSDINTVNKVKSLGFKYVNCHHMFSEDTPFYNIIEKTKELRKYIIDNKIDILIGMHSRPEYNYLFTTRTAPIQLYWSHGNNEYNIKGIDGAMYHGNIPKNKPFIKQIHIPVDYKDYNPPIDKTDVLKEREKFPKDKIIAGFIGRLIKINDMDYLKTIKKILEQNPQLIYLACGSGDRKGIEEKIEQLNIPKDKFYFTGHINSSIYNHILDIFLVSFLGSGEALEEYRYKGKPYVLLHKEELLSKEEIQILIDSIYTNKQVTIKGKSSNLFKPSLYTKEILDSLKKYQYIDKINKNAQMFYAISFAETPEDYINITNEILKNEELRKKISEDLMYSFINKRQTTDFLDYLQEII